jgi:hypothetical protein
MNNSIFQENKDTITKIPHNNDDIYLINQFYMDIDKTRLQETRMTLKLNISLRLFKNIYLLNEKIYTQEELDLPKIEMSNIEQINIKKRLTYSDVFKFVKSYNLNGYIVIANSDIFFDKSIINVRNTSLSKKKAFYALSRFEYFKQYGNKLNLCKLVTNTYWTQDVWIFHTDFLINPEQIKLCDFQFGKVGCDNKIAYLFYSFGFTVYNEPYIIKTYHNHSEQYRNQKEREKERIPKPYLLINHVSRLS